LLKNYYEYYLLKNLVEIIGFELHYSYVNIYLEFKKATRNNNILFSRPNL